MRRDWGGSSRYLKKLTRLVFTQEYSWRQQNKSRWCHYSLVLSIFLTFRSKFPRILIKWRFFLKVHKVWRNMNGISRLPASLRLLCPRPGPNFGLTAIIHGLFGIDENVWPRRIGSLNRSDLATRLTIWDMPRFGQNNVEFLDEPLTLSQPMKSIGGLIKHSLEK